MLSIRPFRVADYPAYTRLKHAAVQGGYPPFSEAVYRQKDESRPAAFQWRRFIAERDGEPVGYAEAIQPPGYAAPGRWVVDIGVAVAARGQGVGRALHAHLDGFLAGVEVRELWASAVEHGSGEAFARRRGFTVAQREALSRLDLHAFDSAALDALDARLAGEGIEIVPAAYLLATDPEAKRRWWDIDWAAEKDIPATGAPTRIPYALFLKYFEAPWFDADAWFVAREGLEWVGITGLRPTADPALWHTTLTAVIRTHRRRGIATALKRHAVDFARGRGGRFICTENEENNPMLAINRRFGFAPSGAVLDLEKQVEGGGGNGVDE